MLDAHPDLAIPAETHFCRLFQSQLLQSTVTAHIREAIFQEIVGSQRWQDFKLSQSEFRNYLDGVPDGVPSYRCLVAFWKFYAQKQGKTRWGDKTPSHILCVPAIASTIPESRFVHIVRDGRDIACSMRNSWFGRGATVSELARDWSDRLIRFTEVAGTLSDRLVTIRYEDVICDPEPALRSICKFIALEYQPAMLAYFQRAEARLAELSDLKMGARVATKAERTGIHARTSSPPTRDRIGRWQKELSEEELRAFEGIAAEALTLYGYEVSC